MDLTGHFHSILQNNRTKSVYHHAWEAYDIVLGLHDALVQTGLPKAKLRVVKDPLLVRLLYGERNPLKPIVVIGISRAGNSKGPVTWVLQTPAIKGSHATHHPEGKGATTAITDFLGEETFLTWLECELSHVASNR